jgi:hypothetical protein
LVVDKEMLQVKQEVLAVAALVVLVAVLLEVLALQVKVIMEVRALLEHQVRNKLEAVVVALEQ